MPREIPVGNGNLLITFDNDYCIRDIYYPYVGQENHADGHRFRTGIWTEGRFSWIGRDEWTLQMEYAGESLITNVTALNEQLGVSIQFADLVDNKENIYLKRVRLKNLSDKQRDFRIFFYHDFHILESAAGDTAYYDPDEKAIIHYKGNRYFLMSGIRNGEQGIDQYATGVKEFHGMQGTWKDAEDGELGGSPISQGSVDSTLSFSVKINPREYDVLYYWMAAGKNFAEVSKLNQIIIQKGPVHIIGRTDGFWNAWLNKEGFDLSVFPQKVRQLYKTSLLVINSNSDSRGAIIAANDSDVQDFVRDTYGYMWPRDGAFAAYALDLAGYAGTTRNFFDYCMDIVSEGKEANGYFLHKYHPDGCLGSSWHPWVRDGENLLPIQEDGTGLILWALWHHFDRFRDIEFAIMQYENVVIRCADFLASYRDKTTGLPLPSYDLWEENWGIHTFTVSAVYAGLVAAGNFAGFFGDIEREGLYVKAAEEIKIAAEKYLYSSEHKRFLRTIVNKEDGTFQQDLTVDASLFAIFYFGLFDPGDERVVKTMEAVRSKLWLRTNVGGLARYEGDMYYRSSGAAPEIAGNPWFICTIWLIQWLIAKAEKKGDLDEAMQLIEWVTKRALPSNILSEQIDPVEGTPLSASPLTWSHAAYVTVIHEYLQKLKV